MSGEIILFLGLLVISVVLFSLERVPVDITSLGVLLLIFFTGLLPANQLFSGFSSDAFMMIFGLLILTAGLERTGVVDMVSRAILHRTSDSPNKLLATIMVVSTTLSGLISNTATTAFFVPVTITLSRKTRISGSKLLMPLAFSTILASSLTLVSSSTNIVISGLMVNYDLSPIGMFELTLVGIPIAVLGVVYMFFIGRRLIPDRFEPEELSEESILRQYITELIILPDSPLHGKTLAQSGLGRDLDITVLRVIRDKKIFLSPQADFQLVERDVMLVKGERDEILKIKDTVGVDIKADFSFSIPSLQGNNVELVEAILLNKSPFIGQNLKRVGLREHYGIQVLGISRQGKNIIRKISSTPLRLGDQLLLQGNRKNIIALDKDNNIRVIGEVENRRLRINKIPFAIAIFIGALFLAAVGLLPVSVSVILGAFIMFLTGCISPSEAYKGLEWKTLIVIGCMLALGSAMEYSGTAKYLAQEIVKLSGHIHSVWLLTAFFTLTLLLTQPMSNQAAAVVVLPVAIQTALQLGLNPRTFSIMIAVAASCSFLTPLEPACLMVYSPGRYKFMDFFKVGLPLTILIYFLAIILVPVLWPL